MTDICLASKKGDVLWYAAPGRAILKVVVLEDYQWDDTVLTAIGKLPVSDSTSALFASEASAISWCNLLRHTSLSKDAALIVLMQHAAGVAVVRGCPEPDYVRCSTELYQMERAARMPKDGA